MEKKIVFGDEWITASFPAGTRTVSPSLGVPLPGVADLEGAIREALERPLERPPLRELARGASRVTVAFDDPTVPCWAPVWATAIPLILVELERAGVDRRAVTLLCANALHRKFTERELTGILGEELVTQFAGRLLCHDAEDPPNLVYLGRTPSGYDVELHRLVADSDLVIYLNASCSGGFSGGWKSICVGLSTWRSIRWHHTPEIMSMSLGRNRLHEFLDEMGAFVEERLGAERFFKIETVLANPMEVARVWGGSVGATRREALELQRRHHVARRDLLDEKVDVVCYGVPNWSPYAAYSSMNPLLTLVSTGLGYLGGMIEALGKPGCSVILATPCPRQWDEVHHPSYREVWERVLARSTDPHEIMQIYEPEFSAREDWIQKYRHENGFHAIHGLMATHPLKRLRHAGRVFVAGIEDPTLARHLAFEPTATVEEALARAREIHGPEASVVLVEYPMAFNRQ
ncbi:MAG: DUF2088 domain-containing protein [Planctomycetes bacterium]|nr:DUF2088 domain-containing protein [Planctomycetota bacterium]